ncbi:exosome complex exonuclease Rrp41 [Candidatus Pacearchaeota archaeon CG_4_9_14_0_2_um_filter_39_13]|nr:exosome complex exonuclease Rrp41 [Candidatus Pacearchaeota archaeon]OIO43496.1 MAG: exosome complex exonuclease Rrp41 [Candidatus Pacearchaeota archaeon CG1_02_39_14]PJC44282.1 MAG: exosome complex exonuclease Rrp41 [Candidatus Pacearchaeota archaeon CG_4_9_14_0_2_um_filter_39_13]
MAIKRPSGRGFDEARKMDAKVGIIPNADGSAMFSFGDTIAIAAVYGPRQLHPQHMQNPQTGILRVNYDLLSFSVADRKKPGPSRRSQEISKVTEWALLPVLNLEGFPNTVVDVQIYILQADAGTRTAGINAASMALAHAGIPMKNLVCSVAVGKLDTEVAVDPDNAEEHFEGGEGHTDMPIAKIGNTDEFTLLQLDGKIPPEKFTDALNMGNKVCSEIYEIQKNALKKFTEVEA